MVNIEVSNCKLLNKGSQKMSCQLTVGPFVIYGWKVVAVEGKEPFSAPPQIPVRVDGQDGTKWYPMMKIEGELRKRIDDAVLAKWRELGGDVTAGQDQEFPF